MSLVDSNASKYLQAVADTLKTELELKNSDIHGGAFNLSEIKTVAKKSPCAFVALLELDDNIDKTCLHTACPLSPVVFLFVQGNKRNADIIDLAAKAKSVIKGNRFGQDYATGATNVKAKNLYTKELGELKVGAWVVNFRTNITP